MLGRTLFLLVAIGVFAEIHGDLNAISKDKKSFEDAAKDCQDQGLTLPKIDSFQKQQKLYDLLMKSGERRLWIGLHRKQSKGLDKGWKWHFQGYPNDNIDVQYWGPGEPNNYKNHTEMCVEVRNLEKNDIYHNWNDRPCHHLNKYFCDGIQKL